MQGVHLDRRVLRLALCLGVLLAGAANAGAGTIMVMNLSGIGNNISLNSFSFGLHGNYVHSGGGWHVQAPSADDFTITRDLDSLSAALAHAAALGTLIPSGDIDFFSSSYSTTIPYLDYHFTDALITSYQVSGGGGGPLSQETVQFTFEHVTVQYAAHPTNPWGAFLPLSSQVQEGPFALNFAFDVAFDAAQFGNSDILMDATIPGQYQPVPEPGSVLLLGSGVAGVVGLLRRKRLS